MMKNISNLILTTWQNSNLPCNWLKGAIPFIAGQLTGKLGRIVSAFFVSTIFVYQASGYLKGKIICCCLPKKLALQTIRMRLCVFRNLSENEKNDLDFLGQAYREDPRALQLVKKRETLLAFLEKNPCALEHMEEAIRKNENNCLDRLFQKLSPFSEKLSCINFVHEDALPSLLTKFPQAFAHANEKIRKNQDFALLLYQNRRSRSYFQYAEKDAALYVIRSYPIAFQHASKEVRSDWKILLFAYHDGLKEQKEIMCHNLFLLAYAEKSALLKFIEAKKIFSCSLKGLQKWFKESLKNDADILQALQEKIPLATTSKKWEEVLDILSTK